MNPFAEAWVQKIKRECLEHFFVLGEPHLRYLVSEYLVHYHEERPHQGIGNRPPNDEEAPAEVLHFDINEIACRERLGGLLKHCQRKVA